MIAISLILGVVGLTAIGLLLVKVKELRDYGYSWSYSFYLALKEFL